MLFIKIFSLTYFTGSEVCFRKASMKVYITVRFTFLTRHFSAEYKHRKKKFNKAEIKADLDCTDTHQAYLLNVIKLQSQAGCSILLK